LQVLLNDFIERARSFCHFDIAINFSGYTHELNLHNSIATFRIIEKWIEVLGRKDSVRHTSVSLHVNDHIELLITDDGSESDFGEMEKTLVMSMVYSRVKMANGIVSYNTIQNGGNVLSVSVPLINTDL
jgi:signal transduction histidine kinase